MLRRAVAVVTILPVACARQPAVDGLAPLTAPAGVMAPDRIETYPVEGADRLSLGRALRAGLTDARGRRFAGYHTWSLSWRYETRPVGSLCGMVRATVTLSSTVTLPVWTAPPDADSNLVAEWARYRQALAVHERGHRELAYAGAGRVQRAVEGLHVQPCQSIAEAARAVADPILAAMRRESEQYDRETRHGATQGVTWN